MKVSDIAVSFKKTVCLDRRTAAHYLSISTRLLDDLATAGHLPRVKIGRKTLFRVVDLDRYIESKIQRVGASK